MSWTQSSVCDECGKTLITDLSKQKANCELRDIGGYTVYGYHLCPSCNTPFNRKLLCAKGKDRYS